MNYQCVVVGAGPSGLACAYKLAKMGIEVLVLERGAIVGEKNVASTVLQTDILEQLIPDFRNDFPYERKVNELTVLQLIEKGFTKFQARFDTNTDKCNLYTVFRGEFDYWLAQKTEEAGAEILCSATVDDLIIDQGQVKGVVVDDEKIFANLVILADGVHSLVAEKAGLIKKLDNSTMKLGCKEVLELPQKIIEDRFQLRQDEGSIIHCEYCYPFKTVKGSVTMYVNRKSICLAVFGQIDELCASGEKLYEILDQVKQHPHISTLIEGSVLKEYQSHLISTGPERVPPHERFGDGYLLCGEAGSMINSTGIGLPMGMLSGILAAETVEQALRIGDYSKKTLSHYLKRQKETSIYQTYVKSLKKSKLLARNMNDYNRYNETINRVFKHLLFDGFICTEKPTYSYVEDIYSAIVRDFIPGVIRWPVDQILKVKNKWRNKNETKYTS